MKYTVYKLTLVCGLLNEDEDVRWIKVFESNDLDHVRSFIGRKGNHIVWDKASKKFLKEV